MFAWIRKLFGIVENYHEDWVTTRDAHNALKQRVAELERIIKAHTTIGVDVAVHQKGQHFIVVCGRYRNTDYVQTFKVKGDDFASLIHRLRDMQRHGSVGRIDAPPELRAVVRRELDI